MNIRIPGAVKFALLFTASAVVLIYVPVEIYRFSWPTATATVTSSSREWFVSTPSNGRGHPVAKIEYAYSVAGTPYSCSNYDVNGPYGHWDLFVSEDDISVMVNAYPVGRSLIVRHKSSTPEFAVIRACQTTTDWMWTIASHLVFGLMLGLWWAGYMSRRRSSSYGDCNAISA